MSNDLSPSLIAQLFAAQSDDPFLTLFTLTHPSFASPIRLVNNTENVTSNGNVFMAFPVAVRLPVDDGESERQVQVDFDNVSLELIDELRSVTDPIQVNLQMVLASIPNDIQIEIAELKLASIQYNSKKITGVLVVDGFLQTEMTCERYGPTNFPGLF